MMNYAKYLRDRTRTRKESLVKLHGGECERCGYRESVYALTFHHIDPATKCFDIGSNLLKSWARLIIEAAKCQLLCANCHAIITREDD